MTLSERIRKLQKANGLTQVAFAAKLGVHPSSIGNYLYEQRSPDALACLLLAGLARDKDDREFFLKQSELTDEQIGLIGAATAGKISPDLKKTGSG